MKKSYGIWGYTLLIISSAFIDVPIIAILAMLIFLAGAILLLSFFLNLIDKEKPHRWLFISLVTIGTLMLAGVLGYSAVEFTQYLFPTNRPEVILLSPLFHILLIIAVNIVSSFIIFIGIIHSSKLKKRTFYISWLPTFFLIPITIILIKIFEILLTK